MPPRTAQSTQPPHESAPCIPGEIVSPEDVAKLRQSAFWELKMPPDCPPLAAEAIQLAHGVITHAQELDAFRNTVAAELVGDIQVLQTRQQHNAAQLTERITYVETVGDLLAECIVAADTDNVWLGYLDRADRALAHAEAQYDSKMADIEGVLAATQQTVTTAFQQERACFDTIGSLEEAVDARIIEQRQAAAHQRRDETVQNAAAFARTLEEADLNLLDPAEREAWSVAADQAAIPTGGAGAPQDSETDSALQKKAVGQATLNDLQARMAARKRSAYIESLPEPDFDQTTPSNEERQAVMSGAEAASYHLLLGDHPKLLQQLISYQTEEYRLIAEKTAVQTMLESIADEQTYVATCRETVHQTIPVRTALYKDLQKAVEALVDDLAAVAALNPIEDDYPLSIPLSSLDTYRAQVQKMANQFQHSMALERSRYPDRVADSDAFLQRRQTIRAAYRRDEAADAAMTYETDYQAATDGNTQTGRMKHTVRMGSEAVDYAEYHSGIRVLSQRLAELRASRSAQTDAAIDFYLTEYHTYTDILDRRTTVLIGGDHTLGLRNLLPTLAVQCDTLAAEAAHKDDEISVAHDRLTRFGDMIAHHTTLRDAALTEIVGLNDGIDAAEAAMAAIKADLLAQAAKIRANLETRMTKGDPNAVETLRPIVYAEKGYEDYGHPPSPAAANELANLEDTAPVTYIHPELNQLQTQLTAMSARRSTAQSDRFTTSQYIVELQGLVEAEQAHLQQVQADAADIRGPQTDNRRALLHTYAGQLTASQGHLLALRQEYRRIHHPVRPMASEPAEEQPSEAAGPPDTRGRFPDTIPHQRTREKAKTQRVGRVLGFRIWADALLGRTAQSSNANQ